VKHSDYNTVEDSNNVKKEHYPLEKTASNLGTFCITNVMENKVNVRIFPSLEAEILFQINKNDIVRIVGVSGEKVTIDSFNGNWVYVVLENGNSENKGWVFSKYLNIGELKYSPINFVEYIPTNNRNIPKIKFSYFLYDKEIITEVDYTVWNDYYIIVWDLLQYDYHYTNKPGVYILNKETNELKHITYLGCFEFWPHAYTLFTDDFEYLLQDSGTSKGPRGITAWRIKDLQEVYSGSYYGMNISNHTIAVVYACDEWSFQRGYTDEEIMAYGKKYREENPVPEEMEKERQETGLGIELIINCSYNLDTGERKILGGTYIFRE
jgi:hypothetical protein